MLRAVVGAMEFRLLYSRVCCLAAEELVYLTADSPDTITQLEKGKVYILGGLVDRNAHKGLCYKKATVRCRCVRNNNMHGAVPPSSRWPTSKSMPYTAAYTCRRHILGRLSKLEHSTTKEGISADNLSAEHPPVSCLSSILLAWLHGASMPLPCFGDDRNVR